MQIYNELCLVGFNFYSNYIIIIINYGLNYYNFLLKYINYLEKMDNSFFEFITI